jgi:hypothetical protein
LILWLTKVHLAINKQASVASESPSVPSAPSTHQSSQSSKPAKLTTISKKLNPFSKKETTEERAARKKEERRKKDLIARYGTPSQEQLEANKLNSIKGTKGGKRGMVVLGAAAAFGAGTY